MRTIPQAIIDAADALDIASDTRERLLGYLYGHNDPYGALARDHPPAYRVTRDRNTAYALQGITQIGRQFPDDFAALDAFAKTLKLPSAWRVEDETQPASNPPPPPAQPAVIAVQTSAAPTFDYEQMSNRELRKILEEANVDVPPRANKATLVSLIPTQK